MMELSEVASSNHRIIARNLVVFSTGLNGSAPINVSFEHEVLSKDAIAGTCFNDRSRLYGAKPRGKLDDDSRRKIAGRGNDRNDLC